MPDAAQTVTSCDVVILGGGLAGLTLAIQLRQARPETTVLVADKRSALAPEAAFKVGESTVEVSSRYLADVLGLRQYLDTEHLHKFGLRWWFPAGDNRDLAERVERGINRPLDHPSYQLDRGRLENHLTELARTLGVELLGGASVEDVDLSSVPHRVTLTRDGETSTIEAAWVVDAAGRASILKRKLGLFESNGHGVNSSWFRLAGGLDIEDWVDPSDDEFFGRMSERGLRRYSTNHLCGKGYWVWMIPLSSGPISIGIVADPDFHSWEEMNTLDGALDWIREHEPRLAQDLDKRRDEIQDFLKVEHFSYGCRQSFSGADRWCLVGEAGPFLDPFYSPGSDFIAISNTMSTDLITRDLDGEDVTERAKAHNDLYLDTYRVCLTQYEGQYRFWGNPMVMTMKICANNILYWGTVGLLFFHDKYTDVEFMAAVRPDLERIWAITRVLEAMYRDWDELESREWRRAIVPTSAFPAMFERHVDMAGGFDDATLKAKLASTAELMEALAVVLFHRAAQNLGDAAPAADVKINPYAVGLDPGRWEADGLFSGDGMTLTDALASDAAGIANLYMEAVAQPA